MTNGRAYRGERAAAVNENNGHEMPQDKFKIQELHKPTDD